MTEHVYVMITDGIPGVLGQHGERVDWQDLNKSFKVNMQANSAYEISFTLTYTKQYADAYNLALEKHQVLYKGEHYVIQQVESHNDENGMASLQITATHALIDMLKDIRIDTAPPTEANPEVSGGDTGDDDSQDPQPGIVTKQTAVQQTYTLDDRLNQFFNNNSWNIKYELHGDFPQAAVECNGSLYDWLTSNLKLYGAYWVPHQNVLDIYDLANFKKPTGITLRYLHDMTNVNIQSDVTNIVNDCWVYGGKMEKDITSILGVGGQTNGVTEPINGDWVPVMQNAASLIGEKLSDDDITNIKNRIMIESGGNETILGGTDGLNDGRATGLLQFKPGTFNYYCRPPYTNIMKGLDQLIAMMNIPNWRGQIGGNSGWSPQGAPISKATIAIQNAVDNSWGWPFSCGEGSFTGGQLFGFNPGGGFRPNGFHDGLDFGSIDHPGNEVHAIHGGRCTISRAWGDGGINWYCVIQDASGLNVEYQEAFGSADNITVNVGDTVKTGDVIGYRTTDHLHVGITRMAIPEAFSHAFIDNGTWIDPLATIKNGTAGGSVPNNDGDTTTSTTTEDYYSLVYHFQDQDSINKYGRHHGAILTVDSIYDMNALQAYADTAIQHNPQTTLTISGYTGTELSELGQVLRLIVPERRLDTDVTLVGIEGNDRGFDPGGEMTLTFNNTGLAMKDVNEAIRQDIKDINTNANPLDYYAALGSKQEDHWANLRFTPNQLKDMQKILRGGDNNNESGDQVGSGGSK